MKSLVFFVLSVLSIQVMGQEALPSLLHVSGQAEVSMKPSLTVVALNIRSSNETYAGTVEDLTQRVDLLVGVLKDLKFKEQEIFTSNFSVVKDFVYVQGERKAKGFNGVQTLKVQFGQNKETLLKVLTAVANSQSDPEISVAFDLKAEEKADLKDELIRQAVRDGHAKAKLIAETSEHQVTGIHEIRYGTLTQPSPVYASFKAESRMAGEVSTFEAENLTFSDQVMIVFEIKSK